MKKVIKKNCWKKFFFFLKTENKSNFRIRKLQHAKKTENLKTQKHNSINHKNLQTKLVEKFFFFTFLKGGFWFGIEL